MTTVKKDIIQALLEKKFLLNPSFLQILDEKEEQELQEFFEKIQEKEKEEITTYIKNFKKIQDTSNKTKEGTVSIVYSLESKDIKKTIGDFVSYFNSRYKHLESMLRNRQELQGITSIKRISQKDEKETVSIIGLVKNIEETKNNNFIITLEDQTGEIKIIINNTKKELIEEAKTIVFDEVIGVVGVSVGNAVFANKIIWPDIPIYNELKKSPDEEFAVFLSDIHIGSKQFLQKDFEKFIKWINGELGNEKQQEIVKKIKYVFVVGDVVDGVGVYPGQEKDLEIKDIKEQYDLCAHFLRMIPSNIKIIICAGNHDAMRLAEPQLPLYYDHARSLYDMPNVIMVSNPSIVNIAKTKTFQGFNVLLYHGYSFDYYIANVDEIRNNGGYDRADLVMKFMLKRRHMAPTHTSCMYIPFPDHDPLIITKIPDFFATGHLHKVSVSNYRNITLIGSSCWQAKTSFQEKMGHNPEPSRVPLVNLQTREVKIMRFGD